MLAECGIARSPMFALAAKPCRAFRDSAIAVLTQADLYPRRCRDKCPLRSCNDTSVENREQCRGTFFSPATNTTVARHWKNQWPNFDNVGNALMVSLVACSQLAQCSIT